MDYSKLKDRIMDSYNKRNEDNVKFGYVDIPQEVRFELPESKEPITYNIDILPYAIKNEDHPDVLKGLLGIGNGQYLLDVYVHFNVGKIGNNKGRSFLCIKKMYNKPCPICEYWRTLDSKDDEEEYKALKVKHRCLYNIREVGSNEIKIFNISYHQFEEELTEESKANSVDGACKDFVHPEMGSTVKFRFKGSLKEFKPFKSFEFIEREPISKRMLNKVYDLSQFLVVPTYDQVYEGLNCGMGSNYNNDDEEKNEVQDDVNIKNIKDDEITECLKGHVFGKDHDQYQDDCDACSDEDWNACEKAKRG